MQKTGSRFCQPNQAALGVGQPHPIGRAITAIGPVVGRDCLAVRDPHHLGV